jgi:hypothetical protein
MYRPSIDEMVAFGNLTFMRCDMYFENVDAHIIDVNVEDFKKKLYLCFLGMAEIACSTPEFFGYNVPDSYQCGYRRVYYKNKESEHHVKIKIKKCCCSSWGGGSRCTAGTWLEKMYDFATVEDAKSFMFRLVLCWLKQESEK